MIIILTIFFLIVQAVLATYVLLRSSDSTKAGLFVALVAVMTILNSQPLFQYVTIKTDLLYMLNAFHGLCIGILSIVMLWLLSHVFMPEWWQGRKPIILVSLPYLLILGFVAIDLFGRFGIFANGLNMETRQSLRRALPGASILGSVFAVGWLVQVVMIIFGVVKRPEQRSAGILLVGSIIFTTIVATLNRQSQLVAPELSGFVSSIPILGVLAYILLRTSLLGTTRATLDLALRSIADSVIVLNQKQQISYHNTYANELGFKIGQSFPQQLEQLSQQSLKQDTVSDLIMRQQHDAIATMINGRHFLLNLSPVRDAHGRQQSTLVIGRDVTELHTRTSELEHQTVEQQKLLDLVATLEAPIMTLDDGVLIAPIVGYLNQQRAQTLTARLLHAAHAQRTRAVILDITGVPEVDASVAEVLVQTTNALQLLGCKVVVSGISAGLATTLIQQNIRLENLATVRSPQEALKLNLGQH